jgi:hypothetical protein
MITLFTAAIVSSITCKVTTNIQPTQTIITSVCVTDKGVKRVTKTIKPNPSKDLGSVPDVFVIPVGDR